MPRKKYRIRPDVGTGRPLRRPKKAGLLGLLGLLLTFAAGAWALGSPAFGQDRADETPRKGARPAADEPGAETGDPIRAEILKVNYVFNRGLFDLALPRYEKILKDHPDYARADLVHFPLAICHYNLAVQPPARGAASAGGTADQNPDAAKTEHLKQAVSHLKDALRVKEFASRSEAMSLLGRSLLLLGDADGAAKTFQWIVEKTKDAASVRAARLGLAEALHVQGDAARAIAIYRETIPALEDGEDKDRAEYFLGLCLYREGEKGAANRYTEAAKTFQTLLTRLGDGSKSVYAPQARYMLALCLEAQGDSAAAAAAFRSIASTDTGPYGELAQFGLGTALFRAGSASEAAAELQKFVNEHPTSERREEASLLLARALLDSRQAAAAAKLLLELRTDAKVGDEASLWLARLYTKHQKARSAANVLAAAIKAFPASSRKSDLLTELVAAHVADGNFDAASKVIAQLEGPSKSGEPGTAATTDQVGYLKAYALHRAGRYKESEAACESFRGAYPKSSLRKDVAVVSAENRILSGEPGTGRTAYLELLREFGEALEPAARLQARFRAAQCLAIEKKYAEASAELLELDPAKLDPASVKAFREDALYASYRYLLGECAYQTKDYDTARRYFTAYLEDSSAQPEAMAAERDDARFKLAHSYQLSGDARKARESYETALETSPKAPQRAQILFELGQMAFGEKDVKEARTRFEAVLAQDPASVFAGHALKYLAWMSFDAKDYEAAEQGYTQLAKQFPQHPASEDVDYQLALVLGARGKSEEARAAMVRFRTAHPNDARAARHDLDEAAALSKEMKYAEALRILEKLRTESPNAEALPSILYEMAWCHRGEKNADAARADYAELLALEGDLPLKDAAALELGELEFDAQRYDKAEASLAPLLAKEGPHREKALYRATWCRQAADDAEGVAARFEDFAKAYPKSPLFTELALLAARAHQKSGENARAAALLQEIADNNPTSPEAEPALVSLGEILLADRKFDKAAERFKAFLERYPDSSLAYRAHFGQGWALENQGNLAGATERYRQVTRETKTATAARAQFQIGQCLVAKKDWKNAIVELLQVPASYSYPEWSSKALLQAAGCFEALEDGDNAKRYYREVAETFPDRDEAKLARDRLQKIEIQ